MSKIEARKKRTKKEEEDSSSDPSSDSSSSDSDSCSDSSSSSSSDSEPEKKKKKIVKSKTENNGQSKGICYGDVKCKKAGCKNGAYFQVGNLLLCGVHSKSEPKRIKLPKRSKAEKAAFDAMKKESVDAKVEAARVLNEREGKKGRVIVCKLKMMKNPDEVEGYLNVFPNFKHQGRKDGFGCAALSPMSLGPIHHGQPDVGPCLNLENFHQGSKCFKDEMEGDKIGKKFYENRTKWFEDPIPHRHKQKETPMFSVFKDKEGKEIRLGYVQSRQLYCNFYERLASETDDFKELKKMREKGTNLQIVGYDGRAIQYNNIEREYLNPREPFGHELVLYTMLVEEDPSKYPWRKHKDLIF
eukprot:TRINITY_DN5850_c0_g1_i1.p1 TRINITY_DN5850_c0_g1~~TRINITY_DN5850_c0_g1_i1.p1  ORF type:complete len:356 (-),score=129.47 TRINITY_DN5850_c0_g1_i1:34-1101(-)